LSLLMALAASAYAQTAGQPFTMYILDLDTNIKGDFRSVAGSLASALETAFSDRPAFRILERRNLSLLGSQIQLDKEVQSILQGRPASPRFVQQVQADGFLHGELVNGPDGVVLTLAILTPAGEKKWQGQAAHTLAEWQLRSTQKNESETLAAKAEARLRAASEPPRIGDDGPHGIELAKTGNCRDAMPFLQNAAAVDSGNAELYYHIGRCQNQTGDFEAAARTLTAGLSRNARRADLFAERARSFVGQRLFNRALEDLDQALRLDSKDPATIELRGDVFLQMGHFADAVSAYYDAYQIGATKLRCLKLADAYKRNGAADAGLERSCTALP
jgi:Flp pilus assembly protein TadD